MLSLRFLVNSNKEGNICIEYCSEDNVLKLCNLSSIENGFLTRSQHEQLLSVVCLLSVIFM